MQAALRGLRDQAQGFSATLRAGFSLNLGAQLANTLLSVGASFAANTRAAQDFAGQITDASRAAGIAVEPLQVLSRLARLSGADIGDVTKAAVTLGEKVRDALTDPASDAAAQFRRLGIDARSFADLAPERQVEAVGAALVSSADRGAAFSAVLTLLGEKTAPKLRDTLESLGRDGLDALGAEMIRTGTLTRESVISALDDAGDSAEDSAARARTAWSDVAVALRPAKSLLEDLSVLAAKVAGGSISFAQNLSLANIGGAGLIAGSFAARPGKGAPLVGTQVEAGAAERIAEEAARKKRDDAAKKAAEKSAEQAAKLADENARKFASLQEAEREFARSQLSASERLVALDAERARLREEAARVSGASEEREAATLALREDMLRLDRERATIAKEIAAQETRLATEAARVAKERQAARVAQIEAANAARIAELAASDGQAQASFGLTEQEKRAARRANLAEQIALANSTAGELRGAGDADGARQFEGRARDLGSQLSADLAGTPETVFGGLVAGLTQLQDRFGSLAEQVRDQFARIGDALTGSISSGIEGLIRGTESWRDALGNIATTLAVSVTQAIADMFAQWIVARGAAAAKSIAFSRAEGAADASAKAPGALLTSISSFGLAAVIGVAALGAAIAALGGFSGGGFTGAGGRNEVAGTVHRGEVVFSQADVARHGGPAAVEAMRISAPAPVRADFGEGSPSGFSPVRSGSSGSPGVTVVNVRSEVEASRIARRSRAAGQITQIVRDELGLRS